MKKVTPLVIFSVLLIVAVVAVVTVVIRFQPKAATGGLSNSKLGIFVQGPNAQSAQIIDAGPRVVKFLVGNENDFINDASYYNSIVSQAKTYKTKYPQGKSLLRFFDFWHTAKKFNPAVDPADSAAQEIFNYYKPGLDLLRSRGDLKYFDYIAGPTNETERTPLWDSNYNVSWLARYWETLTTLNSQAGIKTCAGNILTGDLTASSENINTLNVVLYPKLKSTGSVICYHGYGETYSTDPNAQREHPLHYRDFGDQSPQVIIGELGFGENWSNTQANQAWLTFIDKELQKDSKVIGATIYQIGGGGNYDFGSYTNWFTNYLKSNGGGGTTPPPPPTDACGGNTPTCTDNCLKNIKPGNCSYCRSYCQGTTPPPPPTGGNWIEIEDSDARFSYLGGPTRGTTLPPWDKLNSAGEYVLRKGTAMSCRYDNNPGCTASLNLQNESFSFDQLRMGFSSGVNRTEADVYVDGIKIGAANSNSQTFILNFNNYIPWLSPVVACGKHTIKIVPNGRTGNNAKAFTLDYLDVHSCGTTPPPPPAAEKCQGNKNAPAKCFSCKKDSPSDQVNILDFACFSKFYGDSVGVL